MTPYTLTLKLQGLPRTANPSGRRTHWAIVKREADDLRENIYFMTRGKLPPAPLKRAHITYTRLSTTQPDYDNLVFSFKRAQDSLVACKILENDKPENITATYLWEKAPPRKGGIVIAVEEVPNG